MFYHKESDTNIYSDRRKENHVINTSSDYIDRKQGNWSTDKYATIFYKVLNMALEHSLFSSW